MSFPNLKLDYNFSQEADFPYFKQMRALIARFLDDGGTIVWCPGRDMVELSGYFGVDCTITANFSPILIYGINELIELCMIDTDEVDGSPCVILTASKYYTFDEVFQAKMHMPHGYAGLFSLLFN